MTRYFFLGTTRELAEAELRSLHADVAEERITVIKPGILAVDDNRRSSQELQSRLGGTVKIAEELERLESPSDETLIESIVSTLKKGHITSGKTLFSLITIGTFADELTPKKVKEVLAEQGVSSRFFEDGTSPVGVGAAYFYHKDLQEIALIRLDDKTVALAKTSAVQDIEAWGHRDFGKPYRDAKKGMLPPKVARMMLNLGLESSDPSTHSVWDPFCGSGTILLEAAMIGVPSLVASDMDALAVRGTAENLAWLKKTKMLEFNETVLRLDASQTDAKSLHAKPTLIVTEVFLGQPNPQPKQIEDIARGLYRLYLGTLKRWKSILKPGSVVVVALPRFRFGERVKTMDPLIDRLGELGYTREKGPYRYARPNSHVEREIYRFRVS